MLLEKAIGYRRVLPTRRTWCENGPVGKVYAARTVETSSVSRHPERDNMNIGLPYNPLVLATAASGPLVYFMCGGIG
jgi:hypothetical protein